MKRRTVALCLSMALALTGLAACGNSSSNTTTAAPTTEAPATEEATTAAPETEAETTEAETEAETTEAATEEAAEASEVTERTVYVTADWVKAALDGEVEGYENIVVAEVAYPFQEKAEGYSEGHIPGALYVSIMEIEDATGSEEGAYNLLPVEEMEAYALSHGITKDTKVVLYGDDPSGVARTAYGYLYLGVEDVKILNGGEDAWTAAGYESETDVNEAVAADDFGVEVPANPSYWVSIEDALEGTKDGSVQLVSIRSDVEWKGITSGYSYMDKAGEPEGAAWGVDTCDTAFDVAGLQNEDGTVINMDQLAEKWADVEFDLDEDYLAFYCGTGWRACVPFLIMYEAGHDNVAVYDGGWYEWIMHDDYPVQVGDPADADFFTTTVGELETGKAGE